MDFAIQFCSPGILVEFRMRVQRLEWQEAAEWMVLIVLRKLHLYRPSLFVNAMNHFEHTI